MKVEDPFLTKIWDLPHVESFNLFSKKVLYTHPSTPPQSQDAKEFVSPSNLFHVSQHKANTT